MNQLTLSIFISFTVLLFGCKKNTADPPAHPEDTDSTFTDSRDGQVYKFKQIGSQVWMVQNLNYVIDTCSCYNDDPANCTIYGRLYSWADAMASAPAGWHLPSDEEWTTLTDYLGGSDVAGGPMKSAVTLWLSPNTGATNSSGFSGLPGGGHLDDTYDFLGQSGMWWSSTTNSGNSTPSAWIRFLDYGDASVYRGGLDGAKTNELSVRCIRD